MRANGETQLLWASGGRNNFHLLLFVFGWWNVTLAIFNLIPVPPLDGASVLGSFAPGYRRIAHMPEAQPWGFVIVLIVAMVTPLFQWSAAISAAFVGLFV
jgi:Zn-dependent protease